MQAEVMIIIENTTPIPGIRGDYGLSLLVKVDDRSILFDTGLSEAVVSNLQGFGIDPASIEFIVLSHGHFDHTGGLLKVLEYLGPRDIYVHPEALWPKVMGTPEYPKQIGMPPREEIEAKGGRLILGDAPQTILPGVILSGSIPRTNDYEDVGGRFCRDCNGEWCDDLLIDEQALFIDHPEGLIIISGCAHAGMINTIEYAKAITGQDKIKAYIGGTHLLVSGPERIDKTIDKLKNYDIEQIVVSHCTGFNATVAMYNQLGTRVVKGETGAKFVF